MLRVLDLGGIVRRLSFRAMVGGLILDLVSVGVDLFCYVWLFVSFLVDS